MRTNVQVFADRKTSAADTSPRKTTDTVSVVIEGQEYPVDISYKQHGTPAVREQLTTTSGRTLQPEVFEPVRDISNEHWRRSRPGLAYFSRTKELIPCESRLEMVAVLMLDFEGGITALTSQPFKLHFRPNRTPTEHTPDFFYRTNTGEGVVVDVKADKFLQQPRTQTQFRASREACEQAGWTHRVITTPPRPFLANLGLLSGYRNAPPAYSAYLDAIYELLLPGPLPWSDLIRYVEDETGAHPAFIPPLLLHGLWTHDLAADLTRDLTGQSVIAITNTEVAADSVTPVMGEVA